MTSKKERTTHRRRTPGSRCAGRPYSMHHATECLARQPTVPPQKPQQLQKKGGKKKKRSVMQTSLCAHRQDHQTGEKPNGTATRLAGPWHTEANQRQKKPPLSSSSSAQGAGSATPCFDCRRRRRPPLAPDVPAGRSQPLTCLQAGLNPWDVQAGPHGAPAELW